MDQRPPPPPDPIQPLPDHPQNAINATPQLNNTANHGGDDEGSAQQNSLQMKNFRALVFKFIKPLTPADESLIEQRLRDFFPAINIIPDHPPYPAMIEEAVEKLNGGRGCCEEAISEYIKNEYNSLPWAHPTILSHHLNKLCKKGDIIVRCERGYVLRSPIISSSPCPSPSFSSDYSPYFSSSSSSGSESPTPKRRRLKRKMKRKKSRIHGNGRGGPRMPIPSRGPGRPRKKDEIEMFKRKMMIQVSETGGTRKTINGMKRGRPRKKDEIVKFKQKMMIQARETGGPRMKINGKKWGSPRKNDGTSKGYQPRKEQRDVGEEHHQVLEEDDQLVELENVFEDQNQVADIEMEEIKENNEVRLKKQVVLEQSKAEEQNLVIRSKLQGQWAVKKQKQKKQEKVNSVQINPKERQNDGLEENEQSAEIEVIVDQNQAVLDHPPYPAMIKEALENLNEGRGFSEEAISEYIKNEYNNLPRAHPILVAHHLNKLSKKGDIIVRCEQGYILRSAIISSTTESDYYPSSSSYSISSISLGSDDSPASECSPRRRPLKRTRNRKKSQIQGKGRGRPRNNIPGRGRGRPRKKDEIDVVHDEKFNRKRRIRKRERGGSQEIQGRKRGRPRKKNETSEDNQLRLELTDVSDEHHQAIKEVIQSVELEDVTEDHSQVVDMRIDEIRENSDVQVENQVVSEQSKAEEQNLASRSESQGGGDIEEREKHQKQEKVFGDVLAGDDQREELQNDGREENEQAAEKEAIADENQPWKQEYKAFAGEDQREEQHTYNGDQQDVVMVESVSQVDEIFDECSLQQKQEKEESAEQNQSEANNIFQGQYGSIEQCMEVIEEQIHQSEQNVAVSRQDQQRELGSDVTERNCQEKERHIEIAQEGVQLSFEVSEGQCQEEEQQNEVIQLEDKVVPEDIQVEDKVVEEQRDVQMIVNDQQEEKDGEVEVWNGQREQDKGGSLEHNESEKQVTVALDEQNLQQKQLSDVIVEKNQQCEVQEQGQLERQRVEVSEELHQGEELKESDALKEKSLQKKQLICDVEDRVEQCKRKEMEILDQDQLQREKVDVAEGIRQQEELQVEVFQEEILREMDTVEEQLRLGMIMDDEIEDDGVEKLGPQKQLEGKSVVHKDVEEQLCDVVGKQVQPEGKCMEATRENPQPCEQEETMEHQDREEEQIQTCEQEDEFIIKGDCLVKPETEEDERLRPQEVQQNEEISGGEMIRTEGGGESAEEWSGDHKEEEVGEKSVVNHLEEHENDDSEEQDLAQEQCSEGNKANVLAHKSSQQIIMEQKDLNEQQLEEELNEKAFEKENQLQGKHNVVDVESVESCDDFSSDSKSLPCKAFWSLMEDEKDKFLNNFRDEEMKSPCQEGEISASNTKSEQEQTELPHLKSSPKSHIEEVSCLQHSTSHIGKGRCSKLIIFALPCIKKFPPPDLQNKSERRQSGREALRSRSRNVDEVATLERQPVRRSPRKLNTSSEAAAKSGELDQERPMRPGLRSEKNKKAGL